MVDIPHDAQACRPGGSVRGCFVTGTDTEVGKTVVAAAMLVALRSRGLRAAGMKPVASGCRSTPEGLRSADAELLMEHAHAPIPYDHVNPMAYAPPIAPHIAAREAGVEIRIETLEAAFARLAADADWVVVEGVGGWQVPLNDFSTVADLAVALRLPVVLVVSIRLGCISHALLSAQSIRRSPVPFAGWIANCRGRAMTRGEANIAALQERIPEPLLGIVPYMHAPDPAAVARLIELKPLL